MRIVVAHPGTPPHAQQAVRAYLEHGLLSRFMTTFVYQPGTRTARALKGLYGLVNRDAENQLKRRALEGIPAEVVATHPFREIIRTLSNRCLGVSAQDWIWDWMELDFDRHVAGSDWGRAEAVHGYEYASLMTFEAARRRGVTTLYEMPAPFFRTADKILSEEYRKFPELATRPRQEIEGRAPARIARKQRELSLADIVVCNSAFTRDSILAEDFPPERIITLPLGMPKPVEAVDTPRPRELVLLYAGTLSVRKGVHYLLEAWRRLSPSTAVELRLVGALDLPSSLLRDLPGRVTVIGSVPKRELTRHYLEAGLLLFPTLCDGFGMVLTEALAHGVPVLTTTAAGASSFIGNGCNGFVIAPGNLEELVETMRWCTHNRDRLQEMRPACLESARSWQWSDYRRQLACAVEKQLSAFA